MTLAAPNHSRSHAGLLVCCASPPAVWQVDYLAYIKLIFQDVSVASF